jgi:hypothetical protein
LLEGVTDVERAYVDSYQKEGRHRKRQASLLAEAAVARGEACVASFERFEVPAGALYEVAEVEIKMVQDVEMVQLTPTMCVASHAVGKLDVRACKDAKSDAMRDAALRLLIDDNFAMCMWRAYAASKATFTGTPMPRVQLRSNVYIYKKTADKPA